MNANDEEIRRALLAECGRLSENAQHTATAHFISAEAIGFVHHFLLGPLPVVLGAVGGWKWLAESHDPSPRSLFVASLCSLLAGVFGSLLAFWNLGDLRLRHVTAATLFKSLEHDARRAKEIDALADNVFDLRRKVDSLSARSNKANETSIPTAPWAFERARQKIKKKIFVAGVDKPPRKRLSRNELDDDGSRLVDRPGEERLAIGPKVS